MTAHKRPYRPHVTPAVYTPTGAPTTTTQEHTAMIHTISPPTWTDASDADRAAVGLGAGAIFGGALWAVGLWAVATGRTWGLLCGLAIGAMILAAVIRHEPSAAETAYRNRRPR